MSQYWSHLVNRLTPYVPGEQPQVEHLVKLNTNENPYGPAPAVMRAVAGVTAEQLKLYPDPESTAIRRALAERCGLADNQVFVGNGSDEVLAHVFQGLLKHDGGLCFPDISYSFYPVWCDLYGIDYTQVPLAPDFSIDVESFPVDCGSIIVPNPNAPTGILLGLDEIEQLLSLHADKVVVIDEAYIDFGGASAVSLIERYDNLLVVQTLSKSRALAGLRVGFAMGDAGLIEGLNRVKNSFNSYPLDVLAQAATLASLQDEAYFEDCCNRVIASRVRVVAELSKLGFDVLPSAANFVFTRHGRADAKELFEGLRQRGIIVRYFDKPRIDQFLRISIGTDEQCDELLSALAELLG